jgi:Fe-S-cluster containining protein
MREALTVLNGEDATFECTFGRGCDGICCQNGRPMLYPDESERTKENLHKFLPEMRPESRKLVERDGFLSRRRRFGLPMIRVQGGWCVFFNRGCVLHKVGGAEGDVFKYKPIVCALFPLGKDENDQWYVRQWGYKGEKWDLFCLNPNNTSIRAVDSCAGELALAARDDAETQAALEQQSRRGK